MIHQSNEEMARKCCLSVPVSHGWNQTFMLVREALDTRDAAHEGVIKKLEARIKLLEDALRPFAEMYDGKRNCSPATKKAADLLKELGQYK